MTKTSWLGVAAVLGGAAMLAAGCSKNDAASTACASMTTGDTCSACCTQNGANGYKHATGSACECTGGDGKAAAWSLTQALRAELRPLQVAVHAAFPGPIDTDMIRSFEMPKTGAPVVARAIVEGIASGTEDIAPDPMSAEVLATFLSDPRAVARKFAA